VYGGTSLASPIFTATWAIADQYNGKALGQQRIVARLKSGDIHDVAPPASSIRKYNPTGQLDINGTITSLNSTQIFTTATNEDDPPADLTLYLQTSFLSVIWPGAFGYPVSELDLAISFGTDSSLTVTSGWDNVTRWGEPNGLPFIKGVTQEHGAPLAKSEQ